MWSAKTEFITLQTWILGQEVSLNNFLHQIKWESQEKCHFKSRTYTCSSESNLSCTKKNSFSFHFPWMSLSSALWDFWWFWFSLGGVGWPWLGLRCPPIFTLMVFVFLSQHCLWWNPAPLEMAEHLPVHEKRWMDSLFCSACMWGFFFAY